MSSAGAHRGPAGLALHVEPGATLREHAHSATRQLLQSGKPSQREDVHMRKLPRNFGAFGAAGRARAPARPGRQAQRPRGLRGRRRTASPPWAPFACWRTRAQIAKGSLRPAPGGARRQLRARRSSLDGAVDAPDVEAARRGARWASSRKRAGQLRDRRAPGRAHARWAAHRGHHQAACEPGPLWPR